MDDHGSPCKPSIRSLDMIPPPAPPSDPTLYEGSSAVTRDAYNNSTCLDEEGNPTIDNEATNSSQIVNNGINESSNNRQSKKIYAVSIRWEHEQQQQQHQRRRRRRKSTFTSLGDCCKPYTVAESFNTCCCCCARRVGSMFFLVEKKDGSPIIVAGPCWPFCTFVTVPLIVVLSGLVGYFIVSNTSSGLPWWFALIYYPILAFVLVVLFCVSCRDPGLMERVTDEESAGSGWFWNEQVGSYRPQGAMYCRECQALVHDYDHVCPWTGTAIGKGNMLQFKIFVFSVNVLCYLSIGLVVWQIMDKKLI